MSDLIEGVIAGHETEAEYAIERLNSWLREYGHEKQKVFSSDLAIVLLLARAYMQEYREEKSVGIASIGQAVRLAESRMQQNGPPIFDASIPCRIVKEHKRQCEELAGKEKARQEVDS